jgi:hypothetical protein
MLGNLIGPFDVRRLANCAQARCPVAGSAAHPDRVSDRDAKPNCRSSSAPLGDVCSSRGLFAVWWYRNDPATSTSIQRNVKCLMQDPWDATSGTSTPSTLYALTCGSRAYQASFLIHESASRLLMVQALQWLVGARHAAKSVSGNWAVRLRAARITRCSARRSRRQSSSDGPVAVSTRISASGRSRPR